jgi:two-component system sensor kinase FixL
MDESTSVFMAHVTHELSNPLSSMQFTVQFLERQLADPEDLDLGALRRDVATLKSEISRVRALLKDMRDFLRSGRLNLKSVSVGELAAEIAAVEQHHHRERGIRTELDFPPSLPCVLADRDKLKQVVLNLSKNAAEAMPDGGRLVLRGFQRGKDVVLEVMDTGRGISRDEDIFKPFTTTKPDGLGLGLAISRQIVAAHGGVISYSSEPNKGTTFRISIPVPPLAEAAA